MGWHSFIGGKGFGIQAKGGLGAKAFSHSYYFGNINDCAGHSIFPQSDK